jgi:hypothetical protein
MEVTTGPSILGNVPATMKASPERHTSRRVSSPDNRRCARGDRRELCNTGVVAYSSGKALRTVTN